MVKLQNTLPLIYMSLNENSVYCVSLTTHVNEVLLPKHFLSLLFMYLLNIVVISFSNSHHAAVVEHTNLSVLAQPKLGYQNSLWY